MQDKYINAGLADEIKNKILLYPSGRLRFEPEFRQLRPEARKIIQRMSNFEGLECFITCQWVGIEDFARCCHWKKDNVQSLGEASTDETILTGVAQARERRRDRKTVETE